MAKRKNKPPQKMPRQAARNVVIYRAPSGAIELRGDFARENIWATQAQIALAFGVNVRTVNEHLKNIFKTEELDEKQLSGNSG